MADTQPPSPYRVLGIARRAGLDGRIGWPGESVLSVGRAGKTGRDIMKASQVGAALIVILGAIAGSATGAVLPFASGSGPTDKAPVERTAPSITNATNPSASPPSNTSLGASISSFMQASEADAAATVDTGLFAAKLNDSTPSERARLVRARVAELERRLEKLEQRRAELHRAIEDGTVTPAERAKAARLVARANGLQRAINETEAAAARADIPINTTKLDTLREHARALSGSEVASLATGVSDADERGLPGTSPGIDQGTQDQHGQPAGQADNRTGNETDGYRGGR